MYSLIVFLPLLGFLIAGIAGMLSHKLAPADAADGHGHDDHGAPDAHGGHAHASEAHGHDAHDDHHAPEPSPHSPTKIQFCEYVTTGLLAVSCLLSWYAFFSVGFFGNATLAPVLTWINVDALHADWALRIDTLTAVMLVVVTTVSMLVHYYSIGYMEDDPHRPRFFAYLSLFTFAMLMLVTADNLVQMFFGWEGVGLASYLLIGFWYKRPSANAAAIKAFVVNRVGDFGFALGIFAVFVIFGSIGFEDIFHAAPEKAAATIHFLGHDWPALEVACFLLFMGAMGKSAQFLLHTWLPDAMEGPTPVSALIHAATMVTAGVVMVARLSPLFEYAPHALAFVTLIGGTTAFFAATVGLVQNDIKRVIAYSTCSQLGYMFVALGVGAYNVAIFHLFTHAFFKALLFLGAGSVIHAMHHEQDMRKMGGLAAKIPLTYWMMTIGTLALTGVGIPFTQIGFAGFNSKDGIIEAAYASFTEHGSVIGIYAFAAIVVAALMTSFYSWRLVFMTFHGETRADAHTYAHAEESPRTMTIPLMVLAVGAVLAGMVFHPWFATHEGMESFWREAIVMRPDNHVLTAMEEVPWWVKLSPFVMMLIGFATAWYMYIRDPRVPVALAEQNPFLYRFLLNKWYFDELYDWLLVRPAMRLGRFLWKKGDGWTIDGLGPDGVSARVVDVTNRVVKLQSGYLYHYAFTMLIGVAALFTWYMFGGLH
ncbi:NADH-quinone oxidoreductase subunit L [Labrys wisconsinensis]|uniref:NADH-quinone oxidoreductase subunit L n=1 Tax=Labrys wisconsinensis TaxID=425677 RepID=A0ABU0J3P9_9HYPH|nr:NADH-quinone oxidoreductase subunit L [Labrys wisconsinensis]MDQ0468892.1 NADH-quinone oxidoreductase subunit L [Labrys wisconsinensis]